MKRILLLLTTIGIPFAAHAQNMPVTVNISSTPSPYLSTWIEQRQTVFATVVNPGPARDVKLAAKVRIDGVVQAETKLDRLPTITLHPGVNALFADELIRAEAIQFHGSIDGAVMRSGRLPVGFYDFCLQVFDANTDTSLSIEQCRPFRIRNYQAPQMLTQTRQVEYFQPAQFPTALKLQWSDASPKYSSVAQYEVIASEVLPAQSLAQAFATNVPVFDRFVTAQHQLLWPADVQFDTSRTYVWSVRQLDEGGKPIGESHEGWAAPQYLAIRAHAGLYQHPGQPSQTFNIIPVVHGPMLNPMEPVDWGWRFSAAARLVFQPSVREELPGKWTMAIDTISVDSTIDSAMNERNLIRISAIPPTQTDLLQTVPTAYSITGVDFVDRNGILIYPPRVQTPPFTNANTWIFDISDLSVDDYTITVTVKVVQMTAPYSVNIQPIPRAYSLKPNY